MKTLKKIFITIMLAAAVLLPFSCSDYLDVSAELAENLDIETVFNKPNYTRNWYAAMYNSICEYSNATRGYWNSNPWDGISGQLCVNYDGVTGIKNALVNGYTAGNAPHHRWAAQYRNIRQALIFLQNVKPINPDDIGASASITLSQAEVNQMVAETKVMLAYMYFTLFELYGPVPLVTEPASPDDTGLDYARNSIDEVIAHIDGLLSEAILSGSLLPANVPDAGDLNNIVRPTKTVALALRAKLWVYAASPLFNGGFPEALSLRNDDGKRLFPDRDASKWHVADAHLEAFITHAEGVGHQLYKEYDTGTGLYDPHKSLYSLFQKVNSEIIWMTGKNDYNETNNSEARTNPVDIPNYSSGGGNSYAVLGVSQETVDAFFMANGLCRDDAGSGYLEDGFTAVVNPWTQIGLTYDVHHATALRNDPNVFNMYAGREPRFYASVIYRGRSWFLQPAPANVTNANWVFTCGQGDRTNTSNGESWPRSGYLFGKFKNRTLGGWTATYPKRSARPSIVLRLADFYLYRAEVLNEINPGDARIVGYIDRIRERAGIPTYQEMQANGTKTGIAGNYQEQKKAIVHERWIEFLGEGQRLFDLRRWMICENTPENTALFGNIESFTGMNMYGYANRPVGDPNSFYTRTVIESRHWNRAMYLYPVPQNEINKSHLLKQNPLWEAVEIAVAPAE
jgi:hypothetical protein